MSEMAQITEDAMGVHAFVKTAFLLASVLALAACGGGGSGGGDGFVPASIPPFNAPLNSMNEPTIFNTMRSELRVICTTCDPESSASSRSTNYQIKIDPNAQTVEILEFGNSKTVFNNVDYTNGNTTFDNSINFISNFTTERLKIVLPGPSASNLDFAGYGVWEGRTDFIFPFVFTSFDGEALSFGVPTTPGGMPTTGSAAYNGFMDGYYANGANEIWDLTGSASLTADFAAAQITGALNNISATHITGSLGTTTFGDVGINGAIAGDTFSGSASSSGISGIPGSTSMSGSALGQFYGPNADEVGGVFRMSSSSGGEAVGAFAAGQ